MIRKRFTFPQDLQWCFIFIMNQNFTSQFIHLFVVSFGSNSGAIEPRGRGRGTSKRGRRRDYMVRGKY